MAESDTCEKATLALRMADAIEAAMPRIQDMWGSFPYAEADGDDECMTELRRSAEAWRNYVIGTRTGGAP